MRAWQHFRCLVLWRWTWFEKTFKRTWHCQQCTWSHQKSAAAAYHKTLKMISHSSVVTLCRLFCLGVCPGLRHQKKKMYLCQQPSIQKRIAADKSMHARTPTAWVLLTLNESPCFRISWSTGLTYAQKIWLNRIWNAWGSTRTWPIGEYDTTFKILDKTWGSPLALRDWDKLPGNSPKSFSDAKWTFQLALILREW